MSDLYTADKDETPTASGDGDGAQISAKNQSDVVDALVAEMNPANPTEETQYRTALNNSYSEIQALIPDFQFPDGLDVPIIPTVNIQVNVRVPFGIELALKGLPPYDISDVGEIKLIGAGIRKDLPIPILDVSAGVFYQSMSIGDVLVAKNIAVHAEVGKTLGIPGIKISPFIGAGMDKSTVDLSYTIAGGTLPGVEADKEMSFNMTGENQFRANVGLSLQIAVLHIQGEYSIGKYQAVALNLGVSFK
ncbi:MAG: DUF6588 family protein, partial [Candidatus Marinimicrobia bacterium]|nr:DUF6588 family protein [Candidatus Neomarinimicrobiota bacterium]